MSDFTKADAEAAGWAFAHAQEPTWEHTSETQGERRHYDASYRAEKYVSRPGYERKLVNEEANSMPLLLERIEAYERHLGNLPESNAEAVVSPEPEPYYREDDTVLNAGNHSVHVSVGGERLTVDDGEWHDRDRNEAIYDGEKMVFKGPVSKEEIVAQARDLRDRDVFAPAPEEPEEISLEAGSPDYAEIRSDAQEEAAKEARDSGAPEDSTAVREAGFKAEQKVSDQLESQGFVALAAAEREVKADQAEQERVLEGRGPEESEEAYQARLEREQKA